MALKAPQTAQSSRAAVFLLEADPRRQFVAFPRMPERYPTPKVADRVMDLTAEALNLDSEVAGMRRDPGTAESEVVAHQQQRRMELQSELAEIAAAVANDRARIAEQRATLLAPPIATSDDLRLDQEIRATVGTLPDVQRDRLMAELGEGKHGRVLVALARHPVPGIAIGERGRSLWHTFRTAEVGPQLEALDADVDAIDWAESTLRGGGDLLK
jgi:hypothetical protein